MNRRWTPKREKPPRMNGTPCEQALSLLDLHAAQPRHVAHQPGVDNHGHAGSLIVRAVAPVHR